MKSFLEVPFDSPAHAQIVYEALRVDPEPKRSQMKKVLSIKDDNILCVEFECHEARTMRVSINSFLDLLTLAVNTIDQF